MIARISAAAMRRGGYMAMMGIGAVLGILRGFVLAGILPASEFGFYAAVVAVGLFVAPLIGLGQIEGMRKRFPRLWVEGRVSEIGPISDRLLSIMAARAGTIILTVGVGLLVAGLPVWTVAVFAGGLIAFSMGGAMIMASALRAGPDLTPMAAAALVRGMASFVLATAGALAFGLNGAMAGEALGGLIGLFAARGMFARTVKRQPSAAGSGHEEGTSEPALVEAEPKAVQRASRQGLQLMFGTVAILVPIHLSRPLVGVNFGLKDLGTFAFLMLFVQSVLTVIGITDQMIGPALIRMQHSGAALTRQIRTLSLYVAGMAALIAIGIVAIFVLLTQSFLIAYAEKYAITAHLLFPISAFAILQISTPLDWMLTAHDRERHVLSASLIYLTTFTIGTAVLILMQQPMLVFLWVMAGAKAVQFVVQIGFIRTLIQLRT